MPSLRVLALLLSTLLAPSLAAASEGCSRPVRVAASEMGRALVAAPDGSVGGTDADFLNLVAARSGCRFVYEWVTRARALSMLADGESAVLPAAIHSPARDQAATFVRLAVARPMLITLASRNLNLGTLAALVDSKVTIDVVRGAENAPIYSGLVADPRFADRVSENLSPTPIAEKLATGRSDAALMVPAAIVEAATRLGIADRLAVTPLDGVEPTEAGFYVNENAVPAADGTRIVAAMRALAQEGVYAGLCRKHYASPGWALAGFAFEPVASGG